MDTTNKQADELLNKIRQFRGKNLKSSTIKLMQGEMAVLLRIHECFDGDNSVSPSHLSEILCVTRPTITSALNSLESKGYIYREIQANNRRNTKVFLTDSGRLIVLKSYENAKQVIKYIITKLGNDKTDTLIELITEISQYANDYKTIKETRANE